MIYTDALCGYGSGTYRSAVSNREMCPFYLKTKEQPSFETYFLRFVKIKKTFNRRWENVHNKESVTDLPFYVFIPVFVGRQWT
jgi:hypothetical protein